MTIEIRDGDGTEKHLKASGVGSSGDPYIPEHKETSAASILTAVQAIQTAVELLNNVVSGSEAQVDIVSSALPSGAATAANQSTGNTALAAIQTAVEAIKTAAEILDNAISGSEMQVDVVTLPALPAGTNNIGDMDVASVAIPTTFYMGQKTVTTAGTELALASSQALLSGVTVKALHGNTGWIYVGTNPVTSSTGFVLDAGEQVFIEVDNLADVYIDSSVNGEGVSYIGS